MFSLQDEALILFKVTSLAENGELNPIAPEWPFNNLLVDRVDG
jgi:hypothetical protein